MVDYEQLWQDQWDDTAVYGPAHRHRRRIVAQLVAGLPHDRVLDVGCGDGSLVRELSQKMPGAFSGIDLSSHAIDAARARHPGLSFKIVDMRGEFDIEDQDVVVLSEVLEHLEDDERVLKTIARRTRYVVISVPGGPADNVVRQYGHLRNYHGDLLQTTLEKGGYEVVYFRRWGWPFFDWTQAVTAGAVGVKGTQGRYGLVRRCVACLMYLVYFMNAFRRGTQVFAVGRSKARAGSASPQ